MSSSTWPADAVSIILLPADETGESLFEIAKSWADADLIDRALWVKTSSVKRVPNEPLRINAECIGKSADGELVVETTDLFNQLASEFVKTIRFIKVRKASPSALNDAKQDAIVDECLEALEASLPRQINLQSEAASLTKYQVITLVCSTAKLSVTEEIRSARGGVTIFASPEDRTFPWSSDSFLRDGDRFGGFTMMNIATVAGLWLGIPTDVISIGKIDTNEASAAWVLRSFVTGVLTDRLAKRASAESLGRVLDPLFTSSRPPENCAFILDRDLDMYVDALVDHLMNVDEARLSYDRSVVSGEEQDTRLRMPISQWLGDFGRFSLTKTARIPYWAKRSIVRTVAGYTKRKLLGSSNDAIVTELENDKVDIFDQVVLDTINEIEKARLEAQKALVTPVKLSQARSTPELWRSMREAIFASVDGGYDLQGNGFPVLNIDLRPIFQSVGNAFPDPSSYWAFLEGIVAPENVPAKVNLENLHETNVIAESLGKWVDESRTKVDEIANQVVDATDAIDKLNEQLAAIAKTLTDFDCLITDEDGESKPVTIVEATRIQKELFGNALPAQAQAPEMEEVSLDEVVDEVVDNEVDEETAAPTASVSKPSILSRLRVWFSVVLGPTSSQNSQKPKNTAKEPGIPDLPGLVRLYKSSLASIKDHEAGLVTLEEAIDEAKTETDQRIEVEASFTAWYDTLSRTVYAKLYERMDFARHEAEKDLERLKQEVEEFTAPETSLMSKARERFHSRLFWTFPTHILVGLLAFGLTVVFAPPFVFLVLPIVVSSLATSTLATYIIYFRAWVSYNFAVSTLKSRFGLVEAQNRACRDEVFRMKILHEQALEWLRLLAHSLYHPWAVDESWTGQVAEVMEYDGIPLAMNIAQADVADGAARERLVDAAIEQLIEPGWRSAAFQDLVHIVGKNDGRTPAQFSTDVLDNDLPHASNQSRQLLASYQSDESVMRRIAHRRLVRLVEHLQSSTMTEVRPRVLLPTRNPLQKIEASDYDLEASEEFGTQDWSTYLVRTLCADGTVLTDPTALSTLIVSESAKLDNAFSEVDSVAVVPEYIAANLLPSRNGRIGVVTNPPKRNLPIEFAIRMDFLGPIATGKLSINDGAKPAGVAEEKAVPRATKTPRPEIAPPTLANSSERN